MGIEDLSIGQLGVGLSRSGRVLGGKYKWNGIPKPTFTISLALVALSNTSRNLSDRPFDTLVTLNAITDKYISSNERQSPNLSEVIAAEWVLLGMRSNASRKIITGMDLPCSRGINTDGCPLCAGGALSQPDFKTACASE